MRPRDRAMVAIFVGPAAAALDQFASYALVPHTLILHVITGVAAIFAAGACLVSYRVLNRKTEVFEVDRFLALSGVAMNAFFLLVVLAGYGLPKLLLHPTD